MKSANELVLPAVEVKQGEGRVLYAFAVDGKTLPKFAAISRIARTNQLAVDGYQRPEVLSHITEIRKYIESESPLIPNAVVLAFDKRIEFIANGTSKDSFSRGGHLKVPMQSDWSEHEKPAWVVDGQQRIAAIREARVESFPICVVAFVAQDVEQQREQFILVNSTKPLSKALIYELLPTTQMLLPELLEKRRFPSMLLNRLNYDPDSPLRLKIKTATNPDGVIQDNSILKMLEHSLSDGALYRFREQDGGGDAEAMLSLLKAYWSAVTAVFRDAWELPPNRSRLVHGAGIIGMGFIMDAIADRHHREASVTLEQFRQDLEGIEPFCRWTSGFWDFGGNVTRKWNEIQNTTKDIRLLANYLLLQYRTSVWHRKTAR
ncbi:DGQHR domain-containing protein DpdB [Occallatibacter savannae]|uniref:DGQHR domain-containing protein DpdB n=1 Tax=Occallatibacter savannae TaxID=1002691 RepID=UPI000D6909DA|nr:DGQHR domain-containing protein DpdB [Occallatibacter savannae]